MSDSVIADAPASGLEASTASAAATHAGALLRDAREAQGLHVAALAVSLKVPVRQIEALEADRLDQLPDTVFARALAGSVCRQLKIDPQPVLARLPQSEPRLRKEREPLNEPFRTSESGIRAWREHLLRPAALLALALLVAAIVLMVAPRFHADRDDVAPAATPAPGIPAAPAATTAPRVAPGVVTETVTPAVPGLATAPGAPAGPAASR